MYQNGCLVFKKNEKKHIAQSPRPNWCISKLNDAYFFFYPLIFTIVLTKALSAQEKHNWSNEGEIQLHIKYPREHLNADSAFYFLAQLNLFPWRQEERKKRLSAYSKKNGILLLFDKQVQAYN